MRERYPSISTRRDPACASLTSTPVLSAPDLHANQLLFDPAAPDGDIRLAAGCKTHTNLPVEEAPALDHSFRAYLELLYLDSRMAVELCGQAVEPRTLTSELDHKQYFSVDPDKKTALRVRMTFGLDVLGKSAAGRGGGAPKVSKARGVFLYWHGRLIRAYERVRLGSDLQKLDDVAGVLGVMELNHLEVHQDKQEFKEELGASKRAYSNMLAHVSKNMTDYVLECMGGGGHGGEPLLQLEGFTTRIAEAATQQAEALRLAVQRRQEVDNDGRDVVFCDGCGKYRFVSDELCAQVEQAGDEFRWECSMNPDPLHNSCEAPEEEPRAPEEGRTRAPEEALANPPFLAGPAFAGWRTVQVKRARALGDKTHDVYHYAPGSTVRLRSRKYGCAHRQVSFLRTHAFRQCREVARFLQQAGGSTPREGSGRAKRKASQDASQGAGAGAGDAGARDKRSRGKGVAAGAAASRLEKEAEARLKRKHDAHIADMARREAEAARKERAALRLEVQVKKAMESNARRSGRNAAADSPAPQLRPVVRRFCLCKKPERDCDTNEMVQCIGCDDFFHCSCLVMTQHEIADEQFTLECVLHTAQAIAARERQAALLPPAATPSVSRDVSAAVALAGMTARGEAEVASVRSKPLNWPRDVVYTARNVFTAPGSEEEKRRRLMERRTVIPGVEIFQLPVSHPVALAGALGADGAHPACGVRATAAFAKDDVIGQYTGLVHEKTDRDLESRYVMVIPAGFPALDLKERDELYAIMVIDAKTCGNEMRFINDYRGNAHAPNVKFEERALRSADGTSEELIMAIVAERDIAVGEELTCVTPAANCPRLRVLTSCAAARRVFYGHSFEL